MVGFPGLGIDKFKLDPDAFTVFGFSVKWYGLLICCGMILAILYILSRAKIEKIKSDDVLDIAIFAILAGVIGARVYYVVFKLDEYIVKGDLGATLKNMINIRRGGLAIYGAVIFGVLAIMICCKVKKMRLFPFLDTVAPGLFIGQIVGRWGNFFNIEAFGSETKLPWRMFVDTTLDGKRYIGEVHPTFLYESLWNLIGLILIAIFYKKKKFNGQVFLFYVAWYGFGRFFIEGLRQDSLYAAEGLRISQIVGIVSFVIALALTIFALIKVKKGELSIPASPYYGEKAVANGVDTQSEEVFEDAEKYFSDTDTSGDTEETVQTDEAEADEAEAAGTDEETKEDDEEENL